MAVEDLIIEAKEFFEYYKHEIGKAAKEGKRFVIVSFQDLASFSHELAEQLLRNPEETLSMLEVALEETGLITNVRVRLVDLPNLQTIKIRNIRSKHLNRLIVINGIISQASDIRPQVTNAKFECPSCGTVINVLQIDKNFHEPNRCSCGRKSGFRLVSKEMVDAQRLVIEENPEGLTGGEQPRRISVYLKEDLVAPVREEHTTPGSKVKIIGVLKEVPVSLRTGKISIRFDLSIEANNLISQEQSFEELLVSEEDEKEIRELAADPDLYTKLRDSFAPSVFGYDSIKEALILQLFGGVRKKRSDRSFTRGDIHILLVGDPGVAKSVLLKFISTIAPRGRYVSGKSATAAGITATVIRDEFLRGWSLEAGAMVLANKGIVCIDELEDMNVEDRSAMHEALEQQTVSISKANVQATLRAETSVLGAANPKFGRFDPLTPIAQQINIEPAFINRFDLIFVMRDIPERMRDESIATHVLMEHREPDKEQPIETKLFRKYIAYAKQKVFPELTEQAVAEIKKFYVNLRNRSQVNEGVLPAIPLTARQLEALIRLAEGNARIRLSKKVTREDAKKAIELLSKCLSEVGIDAETKQIDIDRIATGMPTSERSKILFVRESISRLESRLGKLIPIEEITKELSGKVEEDDVIEAIDKLKRIGDIFEPKRNFIQKI